MILKDSYVAVDFMLKGKFVSGVCWSDLTGTERCLLLGSIWSLWCIATTNFMLFLWM